MSKQLFRVAFSAINLVMFATVSPTRVAAQGCSGACCKIVLFDCNSSCLCSACTCPE